MSFKLMLSPSSYFPFPSLWQEENKTKACGNSLETQLIFYYGTRGISVVTAKASHGNKEALSGASVLCLQNTPTQWHKAVNTKLNALLGPLHLHHLPQLADTFGSSSSEKTKRQSLSPGLLHF